MCTVANGCYVVPNNWTLVGVVRGNANATCFSGSAGSAAYEGPSGGSCTCGCTLTMQPTCPAGPLDASYDGHMGAGPGACGLPGTPSTMQNMGPCATDMYTGNPFAYPTLDLEYKPHEMGGACSPSATPVGGSVTYSSQDTVCTPTTPACTPNMPCMPNIPAQYSVCIEQQGNPACPAPFTQKYTIGGTATFGCSSGCNCAVPPCTGTMHLYTSNNCNGTPYDIPASSVGTCVAPGSGEQNSYQSYHYEPDPPPTTCPANGSSNPQNLQLTNPMTICCAP